MNPSGQRIQQRNYKTKEFLSKISNDIVKNKRIIFEALSFDYPVKNNNNLIRQDQFR